MRYGARRKQNQIKYYSLMVQSLYSKNDVCNMRKILLLQLDTWL